MSDLRFAIRQLFKNPGFTGVAVLTLVLGIAGNIVIFSIFNALFLRPFPFPAPEQLVDLDETAPRWNLEYTGISYPEFDGWRQHQRSFVGMGVWKDRSYNAALADSVDRVNATRVSHDLAPTLGIQPVLGRVFLPEEDQPNGAKVAMLGNAFWRNRFGGRDDVVGEVLRLDHEPFTIVGVLPPERELLVGGDCWVPLAMDTRVEQGWSLRGVGRLKEGVSLAMARGDLAAVHQGLVAEHQANENTAPRLDSLGHRYFGAAFPVLGILMGAVGVVLLIACGNVAALMLARGLARARELGLRQALGATHWQLIRLIGLEALLLATAGGLGGAALGHRGLDWLLRSIDRPPPWVTIEVDWRVWLFTAATVLISALLGVLPTLWSTLKSDLHGALQSSAQQSTTGGGGRRSLHALVVAEVALTLVLMVQASLLVQAFRALQRTDPGYRADSVLLYAIALPGDQYPGKEARQAFFARHLERVRTLPGVTAASAVTAPPLGGHWGSFFTVEGLPERGRNEPDPVILQRVAWPGYLETMGIPLVSGRDLAEADGRTDGAQAVVVNETFAKRFWPGQDAVGRRIRHRGPNTPWMTVVGVARDVKHYGADQPMIPGVYLPYAQDPRDALTMVVRTTPAPTTLIPTIRALVRESDPDLAVFATATMAERLAQSLWVRRLTAALFGVFATVALAMALGGVYGVFSYVVSQRTREMGVRLALGAQPQAVLWLVVQRGLALTATGVGLGLAATLLLSPITRSLLFGVSPLHPATLLGVAILLTSVAALACAIPARRAARVDPMEALRTE